MAFLSNPASLPTDKSVKKSTSCQARRVSLSAAGRGTRDARIAPPSTLDCLSTAKIAEQMVSRRMLTERDAKLFMMLSDSRASLFEKVLRNRSRHITLALDGVFGAHNLAAIVRSCDAWGLQDLHIIAQPEEYVPNPKGGQPEPPRYESFLKMIQKDVSVRKVSKSSDKWVTIKEYDGVKSCVGALRQAGYKIFVSSLRTDAKSIHEVDLGSKCAFVLGNERHGVTAEMESEADELFTVPMMGFVESMNVSVAAGNIACLTTTKCRNEIHNSEYFISSTEQRELAHTWLMERFTSTKTPKRVVALQDVTRLGYRTERTIVSKGMFAQVEDQSLSRGSYWPLALRLTVSEGNQVVRELSRRKVGALGDTSHRKRCEGINYFLSSTHALSCEAAIAHSGPAISSRKSLYEFFALACNEVHQLYAPNFDQFGVPILPVTFEESGKVFHELARSAPKTARNACLQFTADVLGVPGKDVEALVQKAGAIDVALCIADMTRCGETRAAELEAIARRKDFYEDAVREVVLERHFERDMNTFDLSVSSPCQLDQKERDCLQILLRICNAAFLCSEVYQTVWDRHIRRGNVARIHSLDFNLLESLSCDAFQEMQVLGVAHEVALARVLFEWERALFRLKRCFADDV